MFKAIQNALLKSWNNHFASDSDCKEQWEGLHAIAKHIIKKCWMCLDLLWMPVETSKLSIG